MNSSVALLMAACTFAAGVAAAAYPDKTINDIIAFGPGGESDVSARLHEPFFKKHMEHAVAIQYKPGAGGAATWSRSDDAPGDSYTFIGRNLPHIVLQPLQKDVGYKKQVPDLAGEINDDPQFIKQVEDKGFAMIDVPLDKMDAFMAGRKKEHGAIAKDMGITRK